jgi:DNA-nicking Smr family endonuclease
VRIIHGKGLRSKNREPVLKPKLGAWLIKRDDILAFCQARSADGGGGAVVVLLQGERRKARG